MKISKKALLAISGLLSISALWLMFVSADSRELFMDVHNAVQHINKVKIISTWSNTKTATLSYTNDLVQIDTDNFILWETWDNKNTITKTETKTASSILWWIKNSILWSYDVIIWWSGNTIGWTYNTILWWEWNNINSGTCWSFDTIVWWKNNNILWIDAYNPNGEGCSESNKNSVIIWGHDNYTYGNYSVVMWNNSSVSWDNSVALWSGSHIEANNSFLWTDGNSPETLKTNDVFVIMAQNWAVINTNKAHSFAKLTLWWPLVLSNSDNQSDIQCGQWQWGGIIKMEKSENNQLCLCSCDGSGWNSMFSYWACSKVCNKFLEPPKCGTEVTTECTRRWIVYSWSCENGKPIEWTWAYFVDKNNVVHRSCQTADGQVDSSCTGNTASDVNEIISACKPQCANWTDFDKNWKSCKSSLECPDGYARKDANSDCEVINTCKNKRWLYRTTYYTKDKVKWMQGFSGWYGYDWYMPLGSDDNVKRTCVSNEEFNETMMHSCTFTCAEWYECGYLNEWSLTTNTDEVATCLPVNRCYWDYTARDLSSPDNNSTGIIITEKTSIHNPRRLVYRNPIVPLNKATDAGGLNNIFTYVTEEELKQKKESGAEWCFVTCGPWTSKVTSTGQRGSVIYNTIENWDIHKGRPAYQWYCQPNCNEESFSYFDKYQYRWAQSEREARQYTGLSVFTELVGDGKTIKEDVDACLWTCPEGSIPITSKWNGENRKYYLEGSESEIEVTQDFAGENKIDNNSVTDGQKHICRHKCGDKQYFHNWSSCKTLDNWYTQDTTKIVSYWGITNYTAQTKINCPTGQVWIENMSMCLDKIMTNEQICTSKNTDWKNWYNWVNNECFSCAISQHYNTETQKCEPCPDPNAADCVKSE